MGVVLAEVTGERSFDVKKLQYFDIVAKSYLLIFEEFNRMYLQILNFFGHYVARSMRNRSLGSRLCIGSKVRCILIPTLNFAICT